MGTHLRVLSESYPMNTNMTGFRKLKKTLHPCALDECRLSIGRVKCHVYRVIYIIENGSDDLTNVIYFMNLWDSFKC